MLRPTAVTVLLCGKIVCAESQEHTVKMFTRNGLLIRKLQPEVRTKFTSNYIPVLFHSLALQYILGVGIRVFLEFR